MRIANLDNRATLVTDNGLIDVERASAGRFSTSTDVVVGQLDELRSWLAEAGPDVTEPTTPDELLGDARLGPVVSRPSQVFAIGLNYRTHALEMNLTVPAKPMVFTKFASSLGGANSCFPIPSSRVDWESELVVVIGRRGRHVSPDDAFAYVAGYCVGNDLSCRDLQMQGPSAQFSLGKSYENFSPIGPWLTTIDEIATPDSLEITCEVNGVLYQDSNTSDMNFGVGELVSYISSVCELRPGDIIFTGSPHGVGQGQRPPIFLRVGDAVLTSIEGLGCIRNVGVAG
jgi:2-keto-4-pentenoate hydratase/2-oxohepta-3-ene-1,7-dioic acid hydratase in catechol pathway